MRFLRLNLLELLSRLQPIVGLELTYVVPLRNRQHRSEAKALGTLLPCAARMSHSYLLHGCPNQGSRPLLGRKLGWWWQGHALVASCYAQLRLDCKAGSPRLE